MTAMRVVAVTSLALVLVGCGGGYYEEAETEAEGLGAPVVVTPAEVPGPSTGIAAAGTSQPEVGSGEWNAKAFLKSIPPNPMGGSDDGLARSRDWKALNWANPAEVSPWKWRSSADDVALIVRLSGGKQDKTAVSRELKLALAEKGMLRMDVYNATAGRMPMAFALFTSVDRVYFESKRRALRPGWNRVVFDLSASDFKCASSEWKHTAAIWGKDDVREIVLLLYSEKAPAAGVKAPPVGQDAGTLVIDSIAVDGKLTE